MSAAALPACRRAGPRPPPLSPRAGGAWATSTRCARWPRWPCSPRTPTSSAAARSPSRPQHPYDVALSFLTSGVWLFFALSGYVIARPFTDRLLDGRPPARDGRLPAASRGADPAPVLAGRHGLRAARGSPRRRRLAAADPLPAAQQPRARPAAQPLLGRLDADPGDALLHPGAGAGPRGAGAVGDPVGRHRGPGDRHQLAGQHRLHRFRRPAGRRHRRAVGPWVAARHVADVLPRPAARRSPRTSAPGGCARC